jgi:hypothetical protein
MDYSTTGIVHDHHFGDGIQRVGIRTRFARVDSARQHKPQHASRGDDSFEPSFTLPTEVRL